MPWLRHFLFLLLIVIIGSGTAGAENPNRPVNFLAMGDWGTNSTAQHDVAKTMAEYVAGAGREFDAMLTLGDNFYVHLSGVDDPRWRTMFEDLYDPEILNFPFYISLGNHDYNEKDNLRIEFEYAAKNPQSRFKLPSKWYKLQFPELNPLVTVLMLDSNRPLMEPEEWAEQLQWLEEQLADKSTPWFIACAHHPLYTNGSHGDNGVLQREWGTLFERYKLDFYLAGHDHDLQHLEIDGLFSSFVLAGGGGARIRPMRVETRGPFSKSMYGFADLAITSEQAIVRLIGIDGEVAHEFERTIDGRVKVLHTTPSDPATPRTVRTVTRPDTTEQKEQKEAHPAAPAP